MWLFYIVWYIFKKYIHWFNWISCIITMHWMLKCRTILTWCNEVPKRTITNKRHIIRTTNIINSFCNFNAHNYVQNHQIWTNASAGLTKCAVEGIKALRICWNKSWTVDRRSWRCWLGVTLGLVFLLSPGPSPRIPPCRTVQREPSLRSPADHHADRGDSRSVMNPWLLSNGCSCLRSCPPRWRAHVTDTKLPIALHQSRGAQEAAPLPWIHHDLRISVQTFFIQSFIFKFFKCFFYTLQFWIEEQ